MTHPGGTARLSAALLAALLLFSAPSLNAQDDAGEPFREEEEEYPRYRLGAEVRTHYRDSDSAKFPVPFPFLPSMLPPGETRASVETVEAGEHVEVSVVTVEGTMEWREDLAAKVKVDFIDRYDRNPTSEDRETDIDEAWVRYGREAEPAEVPERRGWYAKLGKFGKFERQDDRLLESYGLVSTSFNRMEDIGLELGFDLTRNLYLKASFTQGNPVFFRDPNVLAGDNGTSIFDGSVPNPVSEIKTGLPILYDADVDKIDFKNPELGVGLGWRWSSESGFVAFDVLVWGYERKLADEAELSNTFYGGDLDLLLGPDLSFLGLPPDMFALPVTDNDKREIGANLWLYVGGFSLFTQYVDQDLAGLDRTGFEIEATWTFDLPVFWTIGGRQIFPWIAPAVRFSELDPKFGIGPSGQYPAPSVIWDWEKIDIGLRFAVIDELDITVEWQDNTFVRLGREESNDEFLITLTLALEKAWPRL